MMSILKTFVVSEDAAVSVEWVVLSAGVVGMSIAAADVLRDGIGDLTANLEEQLRSQQISDAFVQFASSDFDPLLDHELITVAQAETLFEESNEMTNNEILNALDSYIQSMLDGTITHEELQEAFALASVADQRNIVDDALIEQYFTTEGLNTIGGALNAVSTS